jgi:hypothetical protein
MPSHDMTPPREAEMGALVTRGTQIAEMILDETDNAPTAFTLVASIVAVLLCGFPASATATRQQMVDVLARKSVELAAELDKLA